MAFDTEVQKDGRVRALRFDFSTDKFATVSQRFGTHPGKLDGTNVYDPRVLDVTPLRRGFGQDHIATAGMLDVVFDNVDGGCDFLADRGSMSTIVKTRVRVYVVLFDPLNPATRDEKQLGEFSLAVWPRRTNETLTAQFADDVFTALTQIPILPTPDDWSLVDDEVLNPINNPTGLPGLGGTFGPRTNGASQIPLAWGEDWVRTQDPILSRSDQSTWNAIDLGGGLTFIDTATLVLPVCVTSDTVTAATEAEIPSLRVVLYNADGSLTQSSFALDVPKQTIPHNFGGSLGLHPFTIWSVHRSGAITKDGATYSVIWIAVDTFAFRVWAQDISPALRAAGDGCTWGDQVVGASPTSPAPANADGTPRWRSWPKGYPTSNLGDANWNTNYPPGASRVAEWYVKGCPLSARTQYTLPQQHACDVVQDIATYYCKPPITVDSASRARVKVATPTARCSGTIGDSGQQPKPLRTAVSKICQSADMDIFIGWNGQLQFSSANIDSTLVAAVAQGTLLSFDETRMVSIEDWIPAFGERGAPYNRVTLTGGRPNWAEAADVPFQGPFTLNTGQVTSIAPADRVVDVTLEQGWRPFAQTNSDPLKWRYLDTVARSRVRFTTDVAGLRLELGDFFLLSWSRNVAPIYSPSAFQVEALTYAAENDQVEVEAIWRADFATDLPFLLDDAALLLRVASSGGRTASVLNSSATVTFSSGNLVTDGVVAGDTLVLLDSTQAADVFTRFRALRITAVTTTTLTVSDPSLAFSATVTTAVATWRIQRGATTMHTALTDPTNYPQGGGQYGKLSSSGVYSNAAPANLLLNG